MAFDVSAFKGICSTDAECVSVLGVKALSSMPKRVTFGVNVTVAAGSPKSLVGVDILAVGPTNGVVSVRVWATVEITTVFGCASGVTMIRVIGAVLVLPDRRR